MRILTRKHSRAASEQGPTHRTYLTRWRVHGRFPHPAGAELVITSTWRQFDLPRQRLRDGLARYGLSFTRWVTLGPLPGGRAGQILDFVQREGVGDVSWAVVDDEAVVGDSEESMMMRVSLLGYTHIHTHARAHIHTHTRARARASCQHSQMSS